MDENNADVDVDVRIMMMSMLIWMFVGVSHLGAGDAASCLVTGAASEETDVDGTRATMVVTGLPDSIIETDVVGV